MKRVLAFLIAASVAMLPLGHIADAQPQKTLSVWWTEIDPAAIKVMEKMIAEYERQHPNVKVKLESIAWGALFQKLVASMGAGAPPDLTHLVPYMVDSLYRKGQLVPVTDIVKAIGESDIDEPARLVHLNDGQYYGLAHAMGTSHWNYRADLFRQKGLKFPPTTWDEVLKAAQVLSTPDRPAITLVGESFYIDFWFGEFLMNNGGRFVDPKTFRPAFTDKAFVETLAFFRDLSKYAQRGWTNHKFLDTFVLFATDKTAIFPVNFNRLHLFIKKYAKAEMANPDVFAPALPPRGPSLPAGEKTKVLFDAEPWAIIKGVKNVQEAKDFLKVYYRKDLYRELTLTVPLHLSPILKSIADDPSYEREPAIRAWRPWYDVMRTALRENRAVPLLMTSVQERNPVMLELQGSKVISDMVLDVVVEGKSPEEAAAKGQRKAEELVAKLGWKKW